MGEIRKASLYSQFENITGNQSATDGVFSKVGNIVSPTYEISPKFSFITADNATGAAGGTTLMTTLTDRDFYVTYAMFRLQKDALNDYTDGASGGITFYQLGKVQYLIRCVFKTLVANDVTLAVSYPYPIKVDKNTAISITAATIGAGYCIRSAVITGFYV